MTKDELQFLVKKRCSCKVMLVPPSRTPKGSPRYDKLIEHLAQMTLANVSKPSFTYSLSPMTGLSYKGKCVDPREWRNVTIPEFMKEHYLSRVAKARALVPLREKFALFYFLYIFSSTHRRTLFLTFLRSSSFALSVHMFIVYVYY